MPCLRVRRSVVDDDFLLASSRMEIRSSDDIDPLGDRGAIKRRRDIVKNSSEIENSAMSWNNRNSVAFFMILMRGIQQEIEYLSEIDM